MYCTLSIVKPCLNVYSRRCLHCTTFIHYREDFTKLGIAENASVEEIKSAYFKKAKELHPDSSVKKTQSEEAKFIEITEAYKRLVYEAKFRSTGIHPQDPRNNPSEPEYWRIRKRTRTPEEIKMEEERTRDDRMRERRLLLRMSVMTVLALFFGTIFPALFVGDGVYADHCRCDRCLVERIKTNPSTRYLLKHRGQKCTQE